MKTFLKYAGIISAALAVVAFVLMLSTQAVVVTSGNSSYFFNGPEVMFGCKRSILGLEAEYAPAPLALIAFILAIVAVVVLLAGVILPLLKVDVLTKFAGILNLACLVLLLLAGIFMFCVVGSFYGANEMNIPNGAGVGAGWVIGGILYIAGGVIAVCPAVASFVAKK